VDACFITSAVCLHAPPLFIDKSDPKILFTTFYDPKEIPAPLMLECLEVNGAAFV